jgi:acid phosphatase type 7
MTAKSYQLASVYLNETDTRQYPVAGAFVCETVATGDPDHHTATAVPAAATWSADDATPSYLVEWTATALSVVASWVVPPASPSSGSSFTADAISSSAEWTTPTATPEALSVFTAEAFSASSEWITPTATAEAAVEHAAVASQIVLGWKRNDTSHTMTILWRSNDEIENWMMLWAETEGALDTSPSLAFASKRTFSVSGTPVGYWIYEVELTGLSADSAYHVRITSTVAPEQFWFVTAPDTRRPIMWHMGADAQNGAQTAAVNEKSAAENPEFVVFDGDFVDNPVSIAEWNTFFNNWHTKMITADGRRIPIIPSIGNHEVTGNWGAGQTVADAVFYYHRFPLPDDEPRFFVLDYGPDLSFVTLDSRSTSTTTEQVAFLAAALADRAGRAFVVPHWHVGMYPSYKPYNQGVQMRADWEPVLNQYGVKLVHHGHDHVLHRTPRIYLGAEDIRGVTYIGAGPWGGGIRGSHVDPAATWWIHQARSVTHYWRLTLRVDYSLVLIAEPVTLESDEGYVTGFHVVSDTVEGSGIPDIYRPDRLRRGN